MSQVYKKLKSYKLFLILFLSFFAISYKSISCEAQFLKKEKIFIENKISKKKTLLLVELAKKENERRKGLQCKKYVDKNEGMLFVWPKEDFRYFWMKNTKMPLDLIFINSNFKIVEIYFDAVPFSKRIIKSKKKAQYVLELNAGRLKNLGFDLGDLISFKKNKKKLF